MHVLWLLRQVHLFNGLDFLPECSRSGSSSVTFTLAFGIGCSH